MTSSVRRKLDPWSNASEEPRLSDVLSDPIVQMLMKTDGISQLAINNILRRASQRLSPIK